MMSPSQTADGLTLVDASDRATTDPCFLRLQQALGVISTHNPARYNRIRRDLDRIIVFTATGPEYWPELNACILNRRVVEQESPVGLATTIVHEATHARLQLGGHRYRDETRARIEELCSRAELGFLRTVPGTEDLREKVIRRSETQWWTDEALTERYTRKLNELGAPRWVVRLFTVLRRLRRPRVKIL